MAGRLQRLREGLAHAFSTRPAELTAEEIALLDRVADDVRRRGVSTAVIAALETARPIAGVAGHSLDYFRPLLTPLAGPNVDLAELAKLLRNQRALDHLFDALSD